VIIDASKIPVEKAVIVDTGTGQRIPFVYKADFTTGEYWAWKSANEGRDYACKADCTTPISVHGFAKGRLKAEPLDGEGKMLLPSPEPKKVVDVKAQVHVFKEICKKVWHDYGKESKRCIDQRWLDLVKSDPFLDSLLLSN
jgi:hypothetical protein